MLVIVTGSRHWTNVESIRRRLSALPSGTTIIHGACRGADSIAGHVAIGLGFEVDPHPADWSKYGNGAGIIRNLEMLLLNPDLVIAFHPDISKKSRGTKHCVQTARMYGIPTEVITE